MVCRNFGLKYPWVLDTITVGSVNFSSAPHLCSKSLFPAAHTQWATVSLFHNPLRRPSLRCIPQNTHINSAHLDEFRSVLGVVCDKTSDPTKLELEENDRPIANFNPSMWEDFLLNLNQGGGATNDELEARELEAQVKEQFHLLVAANNATELLSFIDNVQRLGVGYRFDAQIEQALQTIFNSYSTALQNSLQEGLHLTSLRFRLLRQHGFYVPDVFKVFKEEETGCFKETLASDVQGMLSLYEASHLRVHGEDILDEALEFTTFHLKSLNTSNLSSPLSLLVTRSLDTPLHKAVPLLEARQYISIYEQDTTHNKTLLRFAKLDFNFLQSVYKEELVHLSRWWKELDLTSQLPFPIRDRVVESYFWALCVFYEPRFSLARDICLKTCKLTSVHDDIYDAYGALEELESLQKAFKRWDMSCTDELPQYMKVFFQKYANTYKEIEHSLMEEGRSQLLQYAIEEAKDLCEAYLQEARWRHNKHTPTYEEYMREASTLSFGNNWALSVSLLGMGEVASEQVFQWLRRNPPVVEGGGKLGRLMNDMVSRKFERERWHIPSAVECYMMEHGTTKEETHKEFHKQLEGVWKDLNQAMLRPSVIPRELLACQLNLNRANALIYKDEDAYTFPENTMKDIISCVLIHPIPL